MASTATGEVRGADGLILVQSPRLRLVTLLVFYFTQGFPIGLFFYAVPAWMAAHGASTAQVAAVIAAGNLPWTLKLVNGFIIDRYTFLPMGRRRAWIIGAQSLMVLALVVGALLSPLPSDVAVLTAIAFCANCAVTFQDVGIDSLAVDIMPEEERSRAGGVMGGAQLIGMSVTMAAGGYLLVHAGVTVCLLVAAVIPAAVMLFGVALREREGERHLPWTAGESHPRNRAIQVEAWLPLLKNAARAVMLPLSLLLVPMLLARALPAGGFEAFHPVMFQERAGWSATDYSNFNSILNLVSGVFAMTIGGWLVGKVGTQRSLMLAMIAGAALLVTMGTMTSLWSDSRFLIAVLVPMDLVNAVIFVAMIAMAMRMCNPAVAATQFTIYMAIGNFGRPLGASLVAAMDELGRPEFYYLAVAMIWLVCAAIMAKVRFPHENRAQHEAAYDLPQGEALPAKVD